ncbi:hypothetical protein FN846DRAFT_735412 [Sphaerosporella brunnea]|uniref:Secreted protein n=1 Tax=Sphaerosporella brunnea TaxID=1250544 RepID=A0A5J5EW90_9PEZI|nr:hypothetical protein FN846DRAFT_735412 [Sphaerosporella brunnea]
MWRRGWNSNISMFLLLLLPSGSSASDLSICIQVHESNRAEQSSSMYHDQRHLHMSVSKAGTTSFRILANK